MNPYCDCGACCDTCGHDDNCMSNDTTDDVTSHDHQECLYGPPQTFDHDAYTL